MATLTLSVNDTQAQAELATLMSGSVASATQPIQVGTSSYKWTTQTLYNAQNQFVARPSLTCQIVDETLLVNSQMYNTPNNTTYEGFSGDSVIAPDGTILAIGNDATGGLRFVKITDGTQFSQWQALLNGTGGVFIAAGWPYYNDNFSGSYNGFHFNASMAVSEFINGTYTIDIYYWYDDGTHYQIHRARSTDGGNTFTNYTDIGSTGIPHNITAQIQVAAGTPVYNPATGKTSATYFYLTGAPIGGVFDNSIYYSYVADGSSFTGAVSHIWTDPSPRYILDDWVLHSFDVEYINGTYYIVFAGYHSVLASTNPAVPISASSTQSNFFGNFGLYLTQLKQITYFNNLGAPENTPPAPIFTEPQEILVFNSSSATNTNQALYPALNYDGSYLWLTYRLDSTTSVSETLATTVSSNYCLSKSSDLKNFDYPTIVLDNSGNSITTYPNNGVNKYSFVGNQNGYYYFWGDGALWQFVQNSISADVSGDVIGIQVQDQSGGASSINLTIANGNGKWAGPSPSGTNYQAIWKNGLANKNSKIYLNLGYYTSLGVGETVPRNIFYITDITQNVTSTQNDLVIVGQDWNKLLTTTQTAYTYNFQGPDMYNDPFTSTSIQGWNQVTGTWIQTTPPNNFISSSFPGNVFVPYTTYTNIATGGNAPSYTTALTGGSSNTIAALATLSGFSITHPEVTLSAAVYMQNTQLVNNDVDFYPWYLDANNYLQVSIRQAGNGGGGTTNTQIHCNQMFNGQFIGAAATNFIALASQGWYTIFIRMSDYGNNVDILFGQQSYDGNSTISFVYDPTYAQQIVLNWQPTVPYSLYYNMPGQLATVGIGASGVWGTDSGAGYNPATIWTAFYNLKFTQGANSQSIGELTKSLGTLAHVFDYVEENNFIQDLYDPTQWNTSGSVSFANRSLNLSPQTFALQNNQQYADGQIEFDASVTVPAVNIGAENYGFDIVFRSQDATDLNNGYKVRIMNASNNGSGYLVKASLLTSYTTPFTGTDVPLFSSIIPDNLPKLAYGGLNNLDIDLTQNNHYKIAFNKGWVYVFINNIEVLAWYDNNIVQTFSNGYWGFSTVNNGTNFDYAFSLDQAVKIQNIKFPTFWQQRNTFALNPGDDISSAIMQNLRTVNGWAFSDLGGRMKIVILKNNDIVSYYYGDSANNNLIYTNSNDSSDKEYYNSVLVVGDGVSYLATDNASIGANGVLREEVIVDYTITTLADATTRANQELLSIQKFGAQPAPQLNINVGSEIFDVVNIVNTSTNNAMGLNGNYRIYVENFAIDNQSNYNVTLGTGTVTSNS